MDLVVLTGHREKSKESSKKYKYLDLAKEVKKKLWNMKVTVKPIIISALGPVSKGLVLGLEALKIRRQEEITPKLLL